MVFVGQGNILGKRLMIALLVLYNLIIHFYPTNYLTTASYFRHQ